MKLFTLQDRTLESFLFTPLLAVCSKSAYAHSMGSSATAQPSPCLASIQAHDIALWHLGTDQEPVQLCRYSYLGTIDNGSLMILCYRRLSWTRHDVSTPNLHLPSSRSTSFPVMTTKNDSIYCQYPLFCLENKITPALWGWSSTLKVNKW